MGENTKIEWAHHTFNPWIGCQKVSLACDNCYAELLARDRLGIEWGPGAHRRRTALSTWKLPRRWNNRAAKAGVRERVFCASLADVFDNAVSMQWRLDLAALIRDTPALDWMLLTKRIGNAGEMLAAMFPEGVPRNVWIGATIANQAEADRDLPKLRAVKERHNIGITFISVEPMLGPIILSWVPELVICGGEAGPNARPMHPDWARSLRDQCAATATAFLFKQWGEWHPSDQHDPCEAKGMLAFRANGSTYSTADAAYWATRPGEQGMCRIGKRCAGRLLDGVIHNGAPLLRAGAKPR